MYSEPLPLRVCDPPKPGDRFFGLGSSDVAALWSRHFDDGYFRDALDVWLQATGRKAPWGGSVATRCGTALEETISDLWEETRPEWELSDYEVGATWSHPDYPELRATPDYLYQCGPRHAILECKNVGTRMAGHWGPSGTDAAGVPPYVRLQVDWQAAILAACSVPVQSLFVAALIGCQELRTYEMPMLAPEAQTAMLSDAHAWWVRHVEADAPPLPETQGEAPEWWSRMFPAGLAEAKPVEIGEGHPRADVMRSAIELYRSAQRALKQAELDKDQAKDAIKALLGGADELRSPWGKATWRAGAMRYELDSDRMAGMLAAIVAERDPSRVAAIRSECEVAKPRARTLRVYPAGEEESNG